MEGSLGVDGIASCATYGVAGNMNGCGGHVVGVSRADEILTSVSFFCSAGVEGLSFLYETHLVSLSLS